MTRSYKTNQRESVLQFLQSNSGHVSAEEVFRALRQSGYAVGRATIYRYLDMLVSGGLLRKYASYEGRGALYEYDGDAGAEHFHLKCGVCGQLTHLECADADKLYHHIEKDHGFKIDPTRTVFIGTCGRCEKNRESGEKC